jgi:hypothetical protein
MKWLAAAIVFATLVAGWMLRYESLLGTGPNEWHMQRNRLTGAVCFMFEECWFTSFPAYRAAVAKEEAERRAAAAKEDAEWVPVVPQVTNEWGGVLLERRKSK